MELTASPPDAATYRHHARHRYPRRPLVGRLGPEALAGRDGSVRALSGRGVDLRLSRPLEPGRVLLLQVPGPDECGARTLLAFVERTARHPDGFWVVRCRFAGPAALDQAARALA